MKKRKPRPYKKVEKVEFVAPAYVVSLQLGDSKIEGIGETLLAAIKSLEKPVKITTKSILTVAHGEKKHSRGLTIPLAKRLFYPAAQQYLAKNLELLLR